MSSLRQFFSTIRLATALIMTYTYLFADDIIPLPPPQTDSPYSLERALTQRRSVREFTREPIKLRELAQLLWAGQGITSPQGLRTAPSAGALYPLEIYVVAGLVEGLTPGVYHYRPGPGLQEHRLELVKEGDFRAALAASALGQNCIINSAVSIVITAVERRTSIKYGARATRYVAIEVGHAAQNICLQATALGLGGVTVGAFQDEKVKQTIGAEEEPLYIIPIGRKRS